MGKIARSQPHGTPALEGLNSSLEVPVQNCAPSLLTPGTQTGEEGANGGWRKDKNTMEAAQESAPDDLGNKITFFFLRRGIAAAN